MNSAKAFRFLRHFDYRAVTVLSLAAFILFRYSALAQNPGPERATEVVGHFMKPAHIDATEKNVAKLKVASGFKISVFAKDMGHSRSMLQGPDGTYFISDPDAGKIYAVKQAADAPIEKKTIVSGIEKVNSMILHQDHLFFVATQKIYSLDLKASGSAPKVIVDHLPDAGQHWRRVIREGPDGLLYVSIASTCNDCADADKDNATLQRMNFDGSHREVVAKGLRDTMGFDWQPKTHQLFGMDHGVDWRGDELPPEELNEIKFGGDYGWPFCWGEKKPDPNLIDDPKGMSKEKYCESTEAPRLLFPAHSAPIDFKFYGANKFPAAYRGGAFVTMHGSWNRKKPSGYKVDYISFDKEGQPLKSEDFLTGFLTSEGVFGRPSGLLVTNDGSLLISDDDNGVIYRVTTE